MDARRTGRWLPLEAILPDTVRVTRPVVADWRATFWVGFVFVLGVVASVQGAWQMTRGRGGWRRFALPLATGVALLGAAVLARV
jgi:hypothetical protein